MSGPSGPDPAVATEGPAGPVPGTSRRRRPSWWLANVVVPVGFTALLAVFVWDRRSQLSPIWEDPDGDLVWIGVLVVAGQFLNSAEFWVLYRAVAVRVGFWENWMVFTAGQLGNLLPAQAGTIYKFRYMKAVHGVGYGLSGSSYGANLVISFGSAAAAGLVGVVGAAVAGSDLSVTMLVVWLGLGALSVVLMVVPAPAGHRLPPRVATAWSGFRDGWEELRRQPRVFAAVFALDLAKYLLTAWRFQIAFGLLGVDQSFWYFAVIAPAAGIAGAVAVTPGAVGFREVFVTGAAVAMGTTLDTGLLAATVDRGVMLLSSVVLGSIGFATTYPRLRRSSGRLVRVHEVPS